MDFLKENIDLDMPEEDIDNAQNISEVACIDGLELGFVEKAMHPLLSHVFPSKVGGRPAWLALENLPSAAQLSCKLCSRPLTFLLQVYSPIDGRDDCFHRTLFLFMCQNGACYKNNASDQVPMVAFRCQLARQNLYYPIEPPNYDGCENEIREQIKAGRLPHAATRNALCEVCGLVGEKLCSSCRAVSYCCKEHQVWAWRAAQGHKTSCSTLKDASDVDRLMAIVFSCDSYRSALLPELDLVLGPAVDEEDVGDDGVEIGNTGVAQGRSTPVPNDDDEELDVNELEMAANHETPSQQLMRRFKWQMNRAPQQVLRYQWPSLLPLRVSVGQRNAELGVPCCELCGGPRTCEIQVLPQLLCHLKLDNVTEQSPDWGSILLFTCAASCQSSSSSSVEYYPEHVLLHHFDD